MTSESGATRSQSSHALLCAWSFVEDSQYTNPMLRFGNTLTRVVFHFLSGGKIRDTQTGLRAFPAKLLPELLSLPGEQYEYEMMVLAHLSRQGHAPLETPIATVYIDGDRSSHFNSLLDSMRIYFMLLRFSTSSLISAGVDFAGFSLTVALTYRISPEQKDCAAVLSRFRCASDRLSNPIFIATQSCRLSSCRHLRFRSRSL